MSTIDLYQHMNAINEGLKSHTGHL